MSQNFPTEVVVTIEFAGVAKARKLREYFARHRRIYIVVNATGDDVIVPGHLHGDPALRLVLNAGSPGGYRTRLTGPLRYAFLPASYAGLALIRFQPGLFVGGFRLE